MKTVRCFAASENYGQTSPRPFEMLQQAGVDITATETSRPLSEEEIIGHLANGYDALIAGLEPLTRRVMEGAPNLKLIARVGIGFNNVDLLAARELGIAVTYTPDAPTMSVSEMTVGLMITMLRNLTIADHAIRAGKWGLFVGHRLGEIKVGLIGVGRIGKAVTRCLKGGFPGCTVLGCDLEPDQAFADETGLIWADVDTIFKSCDVVSIHIPLTKANTDFISAREIGLMKKGSILVDTSRGKVVNEDALVDALKSGQLGGVAKDVFSTEPYKGPLTAFDNVFLTAHLGGASEDSRYLLETGAAEEVINFAQGKPFNNPIPEIEYERAAQELSEQ